MKGKKYLEDLMSNKRLLEEHKNEISEYVKGLEQQYRKQKEIIDRARKYINENTYKEDNGCGGYWWEIADKDELLKILEDKEVSE